MPQRIDRVHAGGAAGGEVAEHDADDGRQHGNWSLSPIPSSIGPTVLL